MVLTGRTISADEALALGIVNAVVEVDALDAAVAGWTSANMKCSPAAIRASQQSVTRGLDEPSLPAAIANQDDYPVFSAWRESVDAREGPLAFFEKRPPRWSS